jgi:hypothetical protein
MNYEFEHEGEIITIQIDKDNGHLFSHLLNGNKLTYLVKGFEVNFNGKVLQVNWVEILTDSTDRPISSTPKNYIEANPARYEGLYNLSEFSEPAGDVYAKQTINGIMERTLGVKPFDDSGEFKY